MSIWWDFYPLNYYMYPPILHIPLNLLTWFISVPMFPVYTFWNLQFIGGWLWADFPASITVVIAWVCVLFDVVLGAGLSFIFAVAFAVLSLVITLIALAASGVIGGTAAAVSVTTP